MQTLTVETAVLARVADRLDRIAAEPMIRPEALQQCLTDLENNWFGGTAAPLAHSRLRALVDAASHLATRADVTTWDGIPARERDRMTRERFQLPAGLDGALVMGFDPSGDGRLIVAFGDPDTCRNVATYVPGAGTDLHNVGKELDRAKALRAKAGDDTAVIMWLGYDAPDFADAAFETAARKGAESLRQFQHGLVQTHHGEIGQLTVIGHSYGSVVVGVAERDGDLAADDLVALGSPGMGVDRAAQLRDPAHVWHSTAANDPIRLAPGLIHGADPASKSFGGNEFRSAPRGHSGYFDPANPALQAMAEIVTRQ